MAAKPGELPTGTVTFMFTDIEGSTRLLQEMGGSKATELVEEHNLILRGAILGSNGVEVGTEGDAFFAVFETASAAVAAAGNAQRAISAHPWTSPVKVRMGLHSGEGIRGGDNYIGLDVHVAARIAAAASGGQVLISDSTRALSQGSLNESLSLQYMGEHRLKDLAAPQKLYQLVIQGLPSLFPPIKSLGNRVGNLPSSLTSFVGRRDDLKKLSKLLSRTRCLSLTGPGGSGKTRLSLELARNAAGGFKDGAFFVPLAPVNDPAMLAKTIAASLSLPETRGEARPAEERLAEYLRGRETLLVLDNFEQLIAGASVVSNLLRAAEGLKALVTTRVPLRIQGEHEYPVPPMLLPDPDHPGDAQQLSQYESVALFIERALSVKPDFQITNQNAPAIAEICVRLDGLPLAIELAAARVRVLAPEALLERLGQRLKLLVGGGADVPERQQTLRGAIDWSYDLLLEQERMLFRRFSVFRGGCRLKEAELVCGSDGDDMDVFEGISSLVDKSLIKNDESRPSDPRFFMLETIREYAVEKLNESGEAATVRSKHASAYLGLAEQAAPHVFGPSRRHWLDLLQRDHDNLRTAHSWAVSNEEADVALRLVAALWRFWHMRGHLQEGRARAEEALSLPGGQGPTALRARALQAAGGIAHWQAQTEDQAAFYDRAIAIWRDLGDEKGLARALYDRIFAHMYGEQGLKGGVAPGAEALELAEKVQDPMTIANSKWALAMGLAFGEEDFPRAERLLAEAMKTYLEHQDYFMQMWILFSYGNMALVKGRSEQAEGHFRDALKLAVEAMDLSGILFQLDQLSVAANQRGEYERAVRLAAAASALKASSGAALVESVKLQTGISGDGQRTMAAAKVEDIRSEVERWSLEEAIAYAMEAPGGAENGPIRR